jgi:uncharacterized protein (TIGR03437 family)
VVKLSPKGDAIVYYALLGGDFDDAGSDIALDSAGSAIACGITASTNFPVKNAIQPEFGGGEFDGFVTKLSPDGTKLIYSTFIGGPAWDQANGVASDESGNAYVAAWVTNARLPTKNAFQSTPLGGIDSYIVKLSPTGTLLYATYLGGAASDVPRAIAVDSAGSAYVAGSSGSDDFPTKSAYLVARPIPGSPFLNAFVTKLSPGGNSLIYSTFVTGRSGSGAYRIAVDSGGKAYVLGTVSGPDFPVKNAMQPVFAGGDNDRIVFGLTPSGADLVFSTFLGGSGSEYLTGGIGVAPDGSIWITGATNSSDFPTRNAIQPYRGLGGLSSDNAFLTHFSAGGSLLFSTFFGGHTNDWADGVTVDASGSIYLTGTTYSTDFPVKAAYQPSLGGASDIFVTKFTPDATATSPLSVTPSVLPITFVIGGQVPPAQTVTVSSSGSSLSFTPTTDATWLKLSANATTTPASLSISIDPTGLNPGRYTGTIQIDAQTTVQVNLTILDRAPVVTSISPAVISPGQGDTIFTIIGSGFGVGSVAQLAGGGAPFPTTYVDTSTLQILIYGSLLAAPTTYSIIIVNPQSAPSSLLTLTVGIPAPQFAAAGIVNAASFAGGPVAPGEIITIFGTNLVNTVAFDEAPATLVYFSPTQVNVVVPYSVAGPTTTLKIATTSIQLPITASAPGIFAAVPGGDNILVLYATGCGPLTNDDLPRCALPVSVTVNDRPAQVLYAGIAPGLVQGANQINVQLPDGTTSGQLTIVLTAGDASSKPFVWNTQ